ncbi:MAG: hypothetical protein AAGH57_05145 [Pseudomonadota bacterium]
MVGRHDARGLYELGTRDLKENRRLGGSEFGLSFIIPFAVTVGRSDEYSDRLEWVEWDELTSKESKAAELLALPLLKTPDGAGSLYEERVDYHVRLYMIWTWQKRFSGLEPPGPKVRRGMFGRHVARERKPIPRKYIRKEPRGLSLWSGSPRRHSHPTAIALDVVRMIATYGLDEEGEPLPPPNGYELGVDGD